MAAFKASSQYLAQTDDQTTQWLFGWLIMIIVLVAIGRTQSGRALIYYSLALLVAFLFATQYKWIAQMVSQVSLTAPDPNGKSQGKVVQLDYTPTTSVSYAFSAGGITTPGAVTM